MLKNKLKERKGFTLAELLVVIAILAILIAIAIPVFTNMVADAQLRVNQANIRSVRAAAVAEILTNMAGEDSQKNKMNAGTGDEGAGWVATAYVDNNGDVSNLNIYSVTKAQYSSAGWSKYCETGIGEGKLNWTNTFVKLEENPKTSDEFASLKPSNDTATGVYTVRVYITDVKYTPAS